MNDAIYNAAVSPPWDLDAWRTLARAGLSARVAPEAVSWSDQAQACLLADACLASVPPLQPPPAIPAGFFELAGRVLCHTDPQRHALLYRIAWRLTHGSERRLLLQPTDPDIDTAERLSSAVARDTHKMKAFVRFRALPGPDEAFVAWFEPQYCILDRVAPFFVRRFHAMRWAILTPYRRAVWNGAELLFGPGAQRSEAPSQDAHDDLWWLYYASIFNPARLNERAMQQEMPKRYWKNLPEARLVSQLSRDSGARVEEMLRTAEQIGATVKRKGRKDGA